MSSQLTSKAAVQTEKPVPYMRQLCKHFGHRLEADFGDTDGWILFDVGRCELDASASDTLKLTVSAATTDELERMRNVIGSHLERFGKRDGLLVRWDV